MNARTATVAVTGIGGFVGRHVALALLREGYPVHGTVRALGRAEEIERSIRAAGGTDAARLTFGEADLLEERGWAEAFAEVSYVVHTASPFPARLPANEDDLIGPARDGTLRVLRAAHAAGAKRVVLTSSVAAVIYGAGRAPFTEDDWTDPQSSLATPYYRSKTFAERAAWDYAADSGLELVVINPGMVLGPVLGHEIGTSVAVVRNLLKGTRLAEVRRAGCRRPRRGGCACAGLKRCRSGRRAFPDCGRGAFPCGYHGHPPAQVP